MVQTPAGALPRTACFGLEKTNPTQRRSGSWGEPPGCSESSPSPGRTPSPSHLRDGQAGPSMCCLAWRGGAGPEQTWSLQPRGQDCRTPEPEEPGLQPQLSSEHPGSQEQDKEMGKEQLRPHQCPAPAPGQTTRGVGEQRSGPSASAMHPDHRTRASALWVLPALVLLKDPCTFAAHEKAAGWRGPGRLTGRSSTAPATREPRFTAS